MSSFSLAVPAPQKSTVISSGFNYDEARIQKP
jgi:hypothetical protein